MFWFLIFAGPVILSLMGIGSAGTGLKFIWDKPNNLMHWVAGLFLIAVGIAISCSGILLFNIVFTSIK